MRDSVGRRQRLQKAVDRIVHEFRMNARKPHRAATPERPWGFQDHNKVRVFLQRRLGFSYGRIETVYGVPQRTASRWESGGEGKELLVKAAELNRITLYDVAKDVLSGSPVSFHE